MILRLAHRPASGRRRRRVGARQAPDRLPHRLPGRARVRAGAARPALERGRSPAITPARWRASARRERAPAPPPSSRGSPKASGRGFPRFGITLHLAVDGMSLLLLTLTAFLGIVAVGASWTEITERTGFFHFCLMWTLAGVTGVFLSLDLFLFYFFWELMLIPMSFLIGIWGHEKRDLRRAQVLPVHPGERPADAALDPRRRHRRQERARHLELRLRRSAGGADRPGRRHLAHARILRRVRGQAAGGRRSTPGCPTRTPRRRPRARSCSPASCSRPAATGSSASRCRSSPRPRPRSRRSRVALGALGILYGGWVAFGQTRLQAAGGLHQRQPSRLRAGRRLRLERPGARRRRAADDLPRPLDRRAVHARGRAPGARAHA